MKRLKHTSSLNGIASVTGGLCAPAEGSLGTPSFLLFLGPKAINFPSGAKSNLQFGAAATEVIKMGV